jgi:hypothetical protein
MSGDREIKFYSCGANQFCHYCCDKNICHWQSNCGQKSKVVDADTCDDCQHRFRCMTTSWEPLSAYQAWWLKDG